MPRLTILDIQKAQGCDRSLGVIEAVATAAPEVMALDSRVIKGVETSALVRTAIPRARFIDSNGGTPVVASQWARITFKLGRIDSNIEVSDSILEASEDESEAEILTREAVGVAQGAVLSIGLQRIYGTDFDHKGFPGLAQMIDDSMIISADLDHDTMQPGTTSVYLINEGRQGVQALFGKGKAFTMKPFREDSWEGVTEEGERTKVNGKSSNLGAYTGLACYRRHAAARIINVSKDHPLTDDLIAQAISSFPIGYAPTLILCTRRANLWLQQSRNVILTGNATGSSATIAPSPNSSLGVPITVTDSILEDESRIADFSANSKFTA